MPQKIVNEMLTRYSESEITNSLELIKEQNLELFPEDGSIIELKRQQFLLEHLQYLLMRVMKDNS